MHKTKELSRNKGPWQTTYRADERLAAWLEREAERRRMSVQQMIDFALHVFQRLTTCAEIQPKVRR